MTPSEEHQDESKTGSASEVLPSAAAALAWLERAGWKIAKPTFYRHVKEGRLPHTPDGRYALAAVKKYAARNLRRTDGSAPPIEDQDLLTKRKLEAEADIRQAQARHWTVKTKILEGAYVPREAFERELAARAAVFRSDIEHFCRAQSSPIILLVQGDPTATSELTEYLLTHAEVWLSRYSQQVEFDTGVDRRLVASSSDAMGPSDEVVDAGR